MKGTLTIERVSWLSASLVVSVFLLLSASQVQAANISSATDGKWSEPTTWASVAKTGKITFSDDSLNVLGVDTLFTSELQVGSLLRVTVSRGVVFMTVATIVDNTHLTVSQLPTFDSGAAKNFTASTVPKAGDEVTISSGDQVLVEGEVAVNSLSFPSNNNGTSSLSLANGATMIVSGFVVIPRASSPAFNILNVGDGQLSAGSIAFTNGGTQAAKRHQLWIGNGLLSVGNVIQSASSGSALIEFKGAGKLKVAGEFLNKDNATLVPGLGTIEYGGEAVQTIGQFDYYNLTLSGLLVKQFVTGTKIEGELTIAPSGSAVAKLVVGQTIQTKTLILGGVARKSGIWGASDSTATYKDNNYFAPGNGLLMVASSGSSVAQVTNWPTASAITYGQELSASLLTGGSATVGGTFVWQDGGLKPDEVGVSNQTVIFRPNDTGAYDELTAEVSVRVKPSSVLPVITVEDKIYDASQQATISSCQVVALAGDELGCSVNGASFADANVGDNKSVSLGLVLLTGVDAAKYVIDDGEVGLRANIKKRPISIKAESKSKLIGEADPSLTYVIMSGNLVGADQWSGGLTRMSGEELGSYEIQLGDLKISDNYELQFAGANLVISEQAVVEVLADSQAIIYGQTPASLTFKYVGLVEGDSEAGIDVAPVCNIVGDYTTVGVYPIVCAGAVDDSYDFSYKSGTLTVLKAVAGLNISNLEQGYNGQSRSVDVVTDPAGLAVEVLYDGLVMAPKRVGNYEVVVSVSDPNYQGNRKVSLVIKPKLLTITGLVVDDKIYDGTSAASLDESELGLLGVEEGDEVSLVTTGMSAVFDDKHVGVDRAVTLSGLTLSGESSANYQLVQVNPRANISQRTLSVSVVADNKDYDGTLSSNKIPVIVSGSLAEGDSANFSQSFETAGVGEAKKLIPSGNIQDGNGGANYNITWLSVETGVIKSPVVSSSPEVEVPTLPVVTMPTSSGGSSGGSVSGGGMVLASYCQQVVYGEWSVCVKERQSRLVTSKNPVNCQLTPAQIFDMARACGQALISQAKKEVLGIKLYPDGSFLKGAGVKIYWIVNGAKYHVKNLAELWSYKPKVVIKVTEELLANYPDRATVK